MEKKSVINRNQTSHKWNDIEYLTPINEIFHDYLACLFICSLCNIFAYGNAHAYKSYEFITSLFANDSAHTGQQNKTNSTELNKRLDG